MTYAIPAVTLYLAVSQIAAAMTELTAVCVQASYAFLQTLHHAGHLDVEIFTPHQGVIVLTLRAATPDTPAPGTVSSEPLVSTLPTETAQLMQQCVQACLSAGDKHPAEN